jgi:amino acid adenylation domain-containing protein/thioester reductase-like protein
MFYKNMEKIRFCIFGQDHLIIECIKILLDKNFELVTIVTSDKNLESWAESNKYPCMSAKSFYNYCRSNSAHNIDIIFSVLNDVIIPPDILKIPRLYSINLHPALLPKYAGVNPTSWAILNGEKTHGITWHLMSERLDSGDILKQISINILPNDTRASLDMKCIEAAKNSLPILLEDISNNKLTRIKQDLTQRKYYGNNDKPPNNGFVLWKEKAEEIDRLCRALSFSRFENFFGVPKVVIKNKIIIPIGYTLLCYRSNKKAGTVVDINDSTLQIATSSYDISIFSILQLDGTFYSIKKLRAETGIEKGYRLPSLNFEKLEKQLPPNVTNFDNEKYWIKKLTELFPHNENFNQINHEINTGKVITKRIALNKNLLSRYINENYLESIHPKIITLTALLVYLYRINNYENFTVGFSNELKQNNLINSYLNKYVYLNVNFSPDELFSSCLQKISNETDEISDHKTFCTDLLYRHNQLNPHENLYLPTIDFTNNVKVKTHNVTNPLSIFIQNDGYGVAITYKKSSWKDYQLTVIDSFCNSIQSIIEALSHKNDLTIKELCINNKAILSIYNQINDTYSRYPFDKSLDELFIQQVKKSPNSIAIKYQDRSITYQKLHQYSNSVMLHLASMNANESNNIIGVILEPSIDSIISALAIIKLGCAYIFINPEYPNDLISSIIEGSNIKHIIVNKNTPYVIKKLAKDINISLININKIAYKNNTANHKISLSNNPIVNRLAYVCYTSGSTGVPKGVMIGHQSVIHLVKATNWIKIRRSDRIAQLSNLSFDAFTLEMWGALLNGASLVLISKERFLDPFTFSKFLLKEKISIMFLTAALFDRFSNIIPDAFRYLKYLIIGGDVVNPHSVKQLFNSKKGHPKHILNGYGPTENTTFTTTFLIKRKHVENKSIPIGKPISNDFVYIFDKWMNLTPIGVAGELHVGGDGLAFSYINNQALTDKSFIYKLIDNKPVRLYKTGDLVRLLPDYNIDYLARIDRQIKIRGYRVELGAIEAALHKLSFINECVVTSFTVDNNQYLVAYVTCEHEEHLSLQTKIKDELKKTLPLYMVPHAIVVLDKIPLTITGKVNFHKLPSFNRENLNKYDANNLPVTPVQKEMALVWSSLLGIKQIGLNDNFFDLGGNSILAIELAVKLKKKFNYPLQFQTFFNSPTIQFICDEIEGEIKSPEIQEQTNYVNDSILDKSIVPSYVKQPSTRLDKNHILLTGATGFLGVHILYELLMQTKSNIYCLVRSRSQGLAISRILNAFKKYGLIISKQYIQRIKPVISDISQPKFGMNEYTYNKLAAEVHSIYHIGAHVNHLYSYNTLKDVNVNSTIEIIKFAFNVRSKTICYTSSLAAAMADPQTGVVLEAIQSKVSPVLQSSSGYTKSKWVSEALLSEAIKRGANVKIFRPGWIMGSLTTGICSYENNHFLSLLKGCIQLGVAPNWDNTIMIISVDTLSKAIVKVGEDKKIKETVYNTYNSSLPTWTKIIEWLNDFGYKVKLIDDVHWTKQYLPYINADNAVYPLLPIYLSGHDEHSIELKNKYRDIEWNNFNKIIKLYNIEAPKLNLFFFSIYLDYLFKISFLPPTNKVVDMQTDNTTKYMETN